MSREHVFQELFEAEYERLVQTAFRLVQNRSEAEEVVQEAAVDLWRRWSTVLNPGGYLRTSVVNGARRLVRRRLQRDELHRRIGSKPTTALDPDHLSVLDALSRLPERQRTALVLAYFGDFSGQEIADTLGCAHGTAKSLVHRGLKRLRKELTHE